MASSPRIPDVAFVPSEDVAVEGRVHVYTQVGEWVVMLPISHLAVRVYWLLRAHCNHTRAGAEATRAFPSQKRLAAMCGLKRPDQIAAAVKELVEHQAVDVVKERYAGEMRQHNVYFVHLDPPEGFTGWTNTNDYELPEDRQVTASEPTKPQVARTPDISGVGNPDGSGCNQTKNNQTKRRSKTSLPVRRQSGDRRRTKTEAEIKKMNHQQVRAWELEALDEDWLTYDNDALDEDLRDYFDDKWGIPDADWNAVDSMLAREEDLHAVLNFGLKAGRWISYGDPLPLATLDHGRVDHSLPSKPVLVPAIQYDGWSAAEGSLTRSPW